MNEFFERDSFSLRHWDNWGFRVTSDKLGKLWTIQFILINKITKEDDLDGTLKKIVDRVWEPQTDFQKLNTVYMEWYRTSEAEQEEKKKGKQLMLDYIKKRKMTDEGKRTFVFIF